MITNIKSINVFPSWGCCSVHDLDCTELMRCCYFGRYFLHLCSSNALTFHDHSQPEACVVCYELIQPAPFLWNSYSPCQYPTSLSYQETLRNGSFSAKHSAPCCLPLIMQMWFSHAGFEVSFRFYTKHMIGSFNFLAWAVGCISAVLMTLLLGIFCKYYITVPPPQKNRTKQPNLLV